MNFVKFGGGGDWFHCETLLILLSQASLELFLICLRRQSKEESGGFLYFLII